MTTSTLTLSPFGALVLRAVEVELALAEHKAAEPLAQTTYLQICYKNAGSTAAFIDSLEAAVAARPIEYGAIGAAAIRLGRHFLAKSVHPPRTAERIGPYTTPSTMDQLNQLSAQIGAPLSGMHLICLAAREMARRGWGQFGTNRDPQGYQEKLAALEAEREALRVRGDAEWTPADTVHVSLRDDGSAKIGFVLAPDVMALPKENSFGRLRDHIVERAELVAALRRASVAEPPAESTAEPLSLRRDRRMAPKLIGGTR